MEAKTPDLTAMILKKFDVLSEQVNHLDNGITRLSTESGNVVKMLERLETAVEKLETHDDAQQKAIDDLRLDGHRNEAALTAVSNTATQALSIAQRHEGVAQVSLTERERLRKDVDKHTTRLDKFEEDAV